MNAGRNLLASVLLAALSLGAASQAPTAAPGAAAAASGAQHPHRHDPARMQEHAARRQAALKQKLQITPAQEGAWAAYLEAMKPPAGMMAMMGPQRAELEKLTTPERIDRMRAIRSAHMAEMDKRDEAIKAFYAALSPEQRKVFDAHMAPRGRGMQHHHQHHGGAGPQRS